MIRLIGQGSSTGMRKILAIILVFILVALLISMAYSSSQDWMPKFNDSSTTPVTEAGERQITFMLPVTLPDNQVVTGTAMLIQARNNTMQPIRKWSNGLLFLGLLLYGFAIAWIVRWNRPIHGMTENKSEISLYLGGHAPPYITMI